MSYAACKMMYLSTGIENCASGFITHSPADFLPRIPSAPTDDLDSMWPTNPNVGPIPNLVVTAANVLEVYLVRVQEDGGVEPQRGGVVAGLSGASLELVCHYRLHGNVESMKVLSGGNADGGRKRDSIVLTFQDAKISVLEFDNSIHGLRTSKKFDGEGTVTGLLCFLQLAIQELQQALHFQRLSEQTAAKRLKAIAYLSRQIQNPLSGIIFSLKMLEGTELGEDQKQLLQMSAMCQRPLNKVLDDTDLDSIIDRYLDLEMMEFTLQ